MDKELKEIAAKAIAEVVIDAVTRAKERPAADALKALAEDTASALAAGFAKLSASA